MDLVVTILIGVGVGVMVELLLPGHTPSELVLAMAIGIAGALLARYIGAVADFYDPGEAISFVASGVGAILLLLIYGAFFRRRDKH